MSLSAELVHDGRWERIEPSKKSRASWFGCGDVSPSKSWTVLHQTNRKASRAGDRGRFRAVSSPRAAADIDATFSALAREWKEATIFLSSPVEAAMHPAYQRIIGLGRDAIPLLVRELRQDPDHWFWALEAITGESPVPADARGHFERMTQAWLDWADSAVDGSVDGGER